METFAITEVIKSHVVCLIFTLCDFLISCCANENIEETGDHLITLINFTFYRQQLVQILRTIQVEVLGLTPPSIPVMMRHLLAITLMGKLPTLIFCLPYFFFRKTSKNPAREGKNNQKSEIRQQRELREEQQHMIIMSINHHLNMKRILSVSLLDSVTEMSHLKIYYILMEKLCDKRNNFCMFASPSVMT